jgi:hypothetical protein
MYVDLFKSILPHSLGYDSLLSSLDGHASSARPDNEHAAAHRIRRLTYITLLGLRLFFEFCDIYVSMYLTYFHILLGDMGERWVALRQTYCTSES